MEQLSGQDAMFLHAELDGLPQHIGGVSIYNQDTAENGVVRFKQILAMLESRIHLSPIFRRKLEFVPGNFGRPYWVEDPDFDLEYHVRHIALPQPGDWGLLARRSSGEPNSVRLFGRSVAATLAQTELDASGLEMVRWSPRCSRGCRWPSRWRCCCRRHHRCRRGGGAALEPLPLRHVDGHRREA